jgi:hypothetical protein
LYVYIYIYFFLFSILSWEMRNEEYFLLKAVFICTDYIISKPYHHPVPLSWNLGTLTSWNPLGHSRPVTGLLIYITSMIDEWMRIVQWWSNADVKTEIAQKQTSQGYFIHYKSHKEWSDTAPELVQWQAGDKLPGPWHESQFIVSIKHFLMKY